jgi:hypothetical protein
LNARCPAVLTVNAKPVASKLPEASSGPTLPEFTAGAPVHVPLRNQSMLTFPVGGGLPAPPLTVTKSWTVVPTATAVTVWCAALWMSVFVVEGSWATMVCEPAPLNRFWPIGQFVLWVFAGSLQRSCQPTSAESVTVWPG